MPICVSLGGKPGGSEKPDGRWATAINQMKIMGARPPATGRETRRGCDRWPPPGGSALHPCTADEFPKLWLTSPHKPGTHAFITADPTHWNGRGPQSRVRLFAHRTLGKSPYSVAIPPPSNKLAFQLHEFIGMTVVFYCLDYLLYERVLRSFKLCTIDQSWKLMALLSK